jgi:hypothetical protein
MATRPNSHHHNSQIQASQGEVQPPPYPQHRTGVTTRCGNLHCEVAETNLGTVWLPLDFKNLDKKNLRNLKSHPNRLGFCRILTHMHRIQEISKIIFIPNPDFRISSKRDLRVYGSQNPTVISKGGNYWGEPPLGDGGSCEHSAPEASALLL